MVDQRDVVVVGAGLMGAASAWAAARRGLSVTVLEQFAIGHRHGSSHGSARIVRRAYGDDLYTQLSGRAFELWRELEHDSSTPVLRMLGGIDFGARRDTVAIADRLVAVGADAEVLDAVEAQQRWPGMLFSGPVVYHPQAGTLDADRAVSAFLASAQRAGAQVRPELAVSAIRPAGESADVELADGSVVRGRRVIVAAGAWVEPLLRGVVALPPLRVTQQPVFHFPRLDTDAAPWPSVIHDEDGNGVYHLAGGRDGGPGDDRKIGEHYRGALTTAQGRDDIVEEVSRRRAIDYVRRWLPGLDPSPSSAATCLYTTTPNEDFVLDRVGPLVVCSPCSGHGAKFAPLIGELATDLAAGLATGLATGPATGSSRGYGDVPERFRLQAHALGRRGAVSL